MNWNNIIAGRINSFSYNGHRRSSAFCFNISIYVLIDVVYVQRIVHEVDELVFIIPDVAQDPTLPKQAKNCDNEECSAQEVVYSVCWVS